MDQHPSNPPALDVWIEVRPDPNRAGDLDARGVPITERLSGRMNDVCNAIAAVCDPIGKRLESDLGAPKGDWRTDSVEVTLSLDLEAEAGVVISRVATKAGVQVAIKWSRLASTN